MDYKNIISLKHLAVYSNIQMVITAIIPPEDATGVEKKNHASWLLYCEDTFTSSTWRQHPCWYRIVTVCPAEVSWALHTDFLLVSECQQIHSSDATCPPCDHLTPQQLRLPSSSLFTYCVLLCIVTQELLIHLSCLGLVGLERRLSCSCLSSDFSSVIDYKVRWFQPVHTFRYPGLSYVRTEHRSQMIEVLDCCNLPLLWCMLVLMSCVDFWASVGRICV